ncbi:putative N-acetyltransferase CML1 [Rhinophrynus dorsalis]
MSDYCIRLYKDSDYAACRDIFARGITEHINVAFNHALELPHVWLSMLSVFLLLLLTTGSIIISSLAVILALVCLWLGTRKIYTSYVQYCLADDMVDIKKYYLQRDGYCYWVAESAGEVVGMVAAVPSHHPGADTHVELKRMSLAKSHRGKGIAKALCRTLIDFARERGCEAVILETSLAQTDAQKLYERMGFRGTHTYCAPGLTAKFLDFRILCYRYEIPTGR